jgi:hypothetical protein
VRINALDTPHARKDLEAMLSAPVPPQAIVVPKLDTVQQLEWVRGSTRPPARRWLEVSCRPPGPPAAVCNGLRHLPRAPDAPSAPPDHAGGDARGPAEPR